MKYYRDTIAAGKTLMRRFVANARIKTEKGHKRNNRINPTRETVQKVNMRNAAWKLCALLNTYFGKGDLWVTLTYANEPSKAEAKKDLDRLIRKLREHHKKNKKIFRWVAATEYNHKRIHHHVVCSRTDLEILEKYWPHGWVTPKPLDASGNYIKLAEYIIKETDKTFREDDSPAKARYRRSRNMPMPEVKREEVTDRELRDGPKEVNGYYVDKDTIHKYEHAILGVDCMQYIMVSLEQKPRFKKWYRGKRIIFDGEYKAPDERQLTMDELIYDREN
ncbi:MAG: hypothetical protein SOR93_03555 [Clostridiales Family XIII bacterium]|uniref:rolling circle replication-associated protein n=1 Tax=Hominibacterium faecale TaxID=2839743 RepID=UPI0022B2A0DE|nr:hypothetical protein [Hominibacterium faecale]MCI7301846.1 hypothetical protein [Clostridia bacterium]MDY3010323.1 hypothetical protein [Clostridiales Family XIII bacterium]